jgi:hypothetical protein
MHMVSGRLGIDPGFRWPSESDDAIDADNDGQFGTPSKAYIDLSEALSQTLGRQVGQCGIYRVGYLEIGLRNKDDTDDNDNGGLFGGTIFYHGATSHKIDALQLARTVERARERTEIDNDSWPLSTDRRYRGMRFNFDADAQVSSPTPESFTNLVGNEWDIHEVFGIYGAMIGEDAEFTNSLWTDRCGKQNKVQWAAHTSSWSQPNLLATAIAGADKMMDVRVNNWKLDLPAGAHLDVLNGLLKMTVSHSNVDPSGFIDDDYEIQVTVGVYGWEAF